MATPPTHRKFSPEHSKLAEVKASGIRVWKEHDRDISSEKKEVTRKKWAEDFF